MKSFSTSFGIDFWWVFALILVPFGSHLTSFCMFFRDWILNEFPIVFFTDFGIKWFQKMMHAPSLFAHFSDLVPQWVLWEVHCLFLKVPWFILASFWLQFYCFWYLFDSILAIFHGSALFAAGRMFLFQHFLHPCPHWVFVLFSIWFVCTLLTVVAHSG